MSEIDYEIKVIKDAIIEMGSLVDCAIKDAVLSLVKNDIDTKRKVISRDHLINSYSLWIDEDCIKLISLKTPTGKNLRIIITAMKLVSDLEHIADYAVKIAQSDIDINDKYIIDLKSSDRILEISEIVLSILSSTIESFVKEESLMAMNGIFRNKKLFKLHDMFMDEIIVHLIKSHDPIYFTKSISYAARYLERIDELAVKLAEMVIDMVDGRLCPLGSS